jgi:hypothetical protein
MVNSSLARSFRGMVFGGAASVGLMASPGSATTLTFEGLKNGEPIDNYYDSGSGGSGSGPGPNYGVTFTSNSLAFISKSAGGTGNFVNSPPPGNTAALFTGSGDYMNVPAGFMTSLSFYYDGAQSGSVTVYSGLDGAGSPLLNLTLLPDTSFAAAGGFFSGTAESVDFSGSVNEIYFDNVTFGTGELVVPEPASLMLLGAGLLGMMAWLSPKAHRGLDYEGGSPTRVEAKVGWGATACAAIGYAANGGPVVQLVRTRRS